MEPGSTAQSRTGHAHEPIPDLTDADVKKLAERHVAELTDAERTAPLVAPHTSIPRARSALRQVWTAAVWVREMLLRAWVFAWDPRRLPGRLWNHVRLLAPTETFNPWKVLLLVFALVTGFLTYAVGDSFHIWFVQFDLTGELWSEKWLTDVSKSLFVATAVGLLAALWSDLFRNPWLCYRIRRQIKKSPYCILDENLGSRPVSLVPRDDPIEIALRADICDEVLAGVLTRGVLMRDKKDVQILVGEPGAGKTTALLMLAQVLAKIGIVSVLVPLRSKGGQKERIKLAEKAREQFVEQIDRFVRSKDEAEKLWRWLYKRRRVAILTDDIDQIGADGERGAILRQTLEDAMTLDLPVLVTARPAGLPAGIAASAINLTPLESDTALESVIKGASKDPAFKSSQAVASRQLEDWIREGEFTEVPFYLELLASLAATGNCPKLPEMDQLATAAEQPGRYRRMPDGRYKWNPLWVRFLLLERYYAEAAAGHVRRWLGIEAGERRSSLVALEGAALGTLVATGMKARAAQEFRGQRKAKEGVTPLREDILDFLSLDDRKLTQYERDTREVVSRRGAVSAHEAADTGERLRILERDYQGKLQFRHRIMQAYLAGSRLAVILFERAKKKPLDNEKLDIEDEPWAADSRPADARKLKDLQWVSWLLDPHRPEKLTADMALIFAAMCATVEVEAAENGKGSHDEKKEQAEAWRSVAKHIVERLKKSAEKSLTKDQEDGDGRLVGAAVTLEERGAGSAALLGMAVVGEGAARTSVVGHPSRRIDPRRAEDPDVRADPDDALTKLTAAAEAAYAIGYRLSGEHEHESVGSEESERSGGDEAQQSKVVKEILEGVKHARLATRWTKLQAIKAVAQLGTAVPATGRSREAASLPAWKRVWEFARDRDYQVRQAAGEAICGDAYNAYRALKDEIEILIMRAAARSALGQPLHIGEKEEDSDGAGGRGAWALALQVSAEARPTETAVVAGSLPSADGGSREEDRISRLGVEAWREDESLALEALGVVLPAVVSGLREDPEVHALETWQGREERDKLEGERPSRGKHHREEMSDVDYKQYSDVVRGAHGKLKQLVALAFQGYQHPLEDAIARGFKADAMRHAHERGEPGPNAYAGPGWVASNRRIVLDVCARQAGSWYARLLLAQAVALYTIAGAKKQEAYDTLTRQVHRGRERHPFTQRGTRLARAAIRRSRFPRARWHRWIWDDEAEVSGRRHARLNRATGQLAADVTLLLDLKEGSPQDFQEPFGSMRELPHCLSASRDRQEILGKGCPDSCGWNFCPYKQAAPDEPDAQRGVSRAFCREQQRYARHHQPKWQTHIPRRKLRAFWEEMERRART